MFGRGGVLREEATFKPDLHDIKEQALSRPEAGEGRGGERQTQSKSQCRGCKIGGFFLVFSGVRENARVAELEY